MRVCFIVAGMDKRIPFLERCIRCFKESRYYGECDIYCYFQGKLWDEVNGKELFKEVVIDSNPRGVFTPRYELMKRFGVHYDYCIIIDDDLYILPETDYYRTIKFIRAGGDCAVVALTNTSADGRIEAFPDGINIEGGMVFPKSAIMAILNYFDGKEKDYTFEYFWLVCYVKGFDVYRDRRSRAQHVPVRKVNGEYTGFNYSLMSKPYIPMLTEYFDNPGTHFQHGRIEPKFLSFRHLNENGRVERQACRLRMCGGNAQ